MTRVIALPVSGRQVLVRALTGAEELLLLEATDDDLALALALMTHLAHPMEAESAGSSPDAWLHLTPTDVDFFILRLRQFVLGDRIVSDVHCQAPGCSARIDVSFAIDQYIAHHLPARADVRGRGWIADPRMNLDGIGSRTRAAGLPREAALPAPCFGCRRPRICGMWRLGATRRLN